MATTASAFPADPPGSSHSSKTDFCRFVLNELETTVAVNVIIYQETFNFRAKWQITILSLREKPLSVHLREWGQSSQQDTAAASQIHASLLNYFVTWTLWKATLQLVQQNKTKKNNRHWKYNCACPGLCFIFISSWKKEKRQKERTLAALNQSCFQSEWNKLQKLDYCNMNHSVRAFILFSSLSPCFWVKLTLACVWDRLEWVLTLRAAWVLARVLPCKIRRTVSDRSCRTESQLSVDLLCHKKARIYTFFVLFSVYKEVRFKVCSNL